MKKIKKKCSEFLLIKRNVKDGLPPFPQIPDSKGTVVCERHWPKNHPTIVLQGKPRPADPLSAFNRVPPSLILSS